MNKQDENFNKETETIKKEPNRNPGAGENDSL